MNRVKKQVAICLFVYCCLASAQFSRAEDAEVRQHLKEDLAVLHVWLGTGENGQAWRRFLQSGGLQNLIAQGEQADPAAVAEILTIYQSAAPGLELPRFLDVRNDLAAWLKTLAPTAVEMSLADAIVQAQQHYRPIPPAEVVRRRAALERAMKELTRYLRATSAERLANWRAYLQWDALTRELASDDGPDLGALEKVVRQLRSGEAGLELTHFANLRTRLASYINGVRYTTNAEAEATYKKRLGELAELLKTYDEHPSTETASSISRYLNWLVDSGLAPALVAQVRRQYNQPNLYIAASHALVSAGLEEDVDEYTEVRDSILGSTIRGGGKTRGRVSVELLPNTEYADLLIKLQAKNHAKTRAYRKPVVVFNKSRTSIYAAGRVGVDAQGLHFGGAVARCDTDSQITGISAKHRFIEKIANKKAHQLKGQASRIAARHAETRASRQMNERVEEMLVDANKSFDEKFRLPLQRRFAFPQLLRFSTTFDHLKILALQADPHHLAAPAPPSPGASPGPPADLTVQVHESMLRNSSEMALGGRQLTKDKLAELFKEFDQELPPELANAPAEEGEEPEEDDWAVDFASQSPFAATFDGQRIIFTVLAKRFAGRGTVSRHPTKVTATYDIAPGNIAAGQPPKLIRDGEVQTEFVTRKRLGPADFAVRAKIKRRFEQIFKPEIVFDDIELPERMASAGPLRLISLNANNGWLTLGWSLDRRATSESPPAPEVAAK